MEALPAGRRPKWEEGWIAAFLVERREKRRAGGAPSTRLVSLPGAHVYVRVKHGLTCKQGGRKQGLFPVADLSAASAVNVALQMSRLDNSAADEAAQGVDWGSSVAAHKRLVPSSHQPRMTNRQTNVPPREQSTFPPSSLQAQYEETPLFPTAACRVHREAAGVPCREAGQTQRSKIKPYPTPERGSGY